MSLLLSKSANQKIKTASIIIPSHNEESVIKDTLLCLLEGLEGIDVQILVVCNGCSDRTAEIAREVNDPRLHVLKISIGSKPAALNMGDFNTDVFPRIYMDADVKFSGRAVKKLVSYMYRSSVPAATPRAIMNLNGSPWVVRAYYKVWFSLPYVKSGMVGCGVYALSQVGRERFGQFPEIISDDGYVRTHFSNEERPVVQDCEVIVEAPRSLMGLIRIKTRSRLGGRQLRLLYPQLFNKELSNPRLSAVVSRLSEPRLWLALPCYLLVVAASIWRSWWQMRRRQFDHWERDDTSRQQVINN